MPVNNTHFNTLTHYIHISTLTSPMPPLVRGRRAGHVPDVFSARLLQHDAENQHEETAEDYPPTQEQSSGLLLRRVHEQ